MCCARVYRQCVAQHVIGVVHIGWSWLVGPLPATDRGSTSSSTNQCHTHRLLKSSFVRSFLNTLLLFVVASLLSAAPARFAFAAVVVMLKGWWASSCSSSSAVAPTNAAANQAHVIADLQQHHHHRRYVSARHVTGLCQQQ